MGDRSAVQLRTCGTKAKHEEIANPGVARSKASSHKGRKRTTLGPFEKREPRQTHVGALPKMLIKLSVDSGTFSRWRNAQCKRKTTKPTEGKEDKSPRTRKRKEAKAHSSLSF